MSLLNIVPQQSLSYLVPALTKPFPIWYQRVVGWGSYFGLVVLDNPVLANTLTVADLQNIQTLMERGEWELRLTDGLPQCSHAVLKPWVGRYYGVLYFHSSWKWKCKLLICVQVLASPWTVAHQILLSMKFSRQDYWSGKPLPPPGESSRPRDWTRISFIAGRFFTVWVTREALPTPPISTDLAQDSFFFFFFFSTRFLIRPIGHWALSHISRCLYQ